MHDKIIKAITNAAACGVFVFASGFDSDTRGCIICAVGMAVCIGWIALFELANR